MLDEARRPTADFRSNLGQRQRSHVADTPDTLSRAPPEDDLLSLTKIHDNRVASHALYRRYYDVEGDAWQSATQTRQ